MSTRALASSVRYARVASTRCSITAEVGPFVAALHPNQVAVAPYVTAPSEQPAPARGYYQMSISIHDWRRTFNHETKPLTLAIWTHTLSTTESQTNICRTMSTRALASSVRYARVASTTRVTLKTPHTIQSEKQIVHFSIQAKPIIFTCKHEQGLTNLWNQDRHTLQRRETKY